MKFIGQYIQSFIARFRNDVYLEDIAAGTIASGSNLGLDSNNKIVKADVPADGDITSVVAGTNLSGGATSGAATINLADASDSVKGAASFNPNNFTASSGAISIRDSGIDLTAEVTGVLPSANMDGDTAHLTTNQTFTGTKTFDENVSLAGLVLDSNTITGVDDSSEFTDNDAHIMTSAAINDRFAQINANTTGSAATLTTPRAINGVNFDGSAAITVTAAGSTLSDTVTVAKGGTGATSLTDGGILLGSGTGAVTAFSVLGDGEILIGDGTTDPVALDVGSSTAITVLGTVATGVWNGTTIATANTAAKVTSVIAGDGIDVDSTTGDVTVTAETASATNPGVVELATTAEADSGTDTARAITAAGLKSHVDARFSYQNISFTGQSTVPSDGDWMTVSSNGISNHTWNTNLGSGGTSVGSTTVTIPTGQICQGIIVPYDCVLVGFASLIRSVGNHQSKVGLAVGVPTYNDFATFDCTLRAYNAADVSAGPDSNYSQRPTRADFLTANYAMSAGHVIFPLIGSVASNSRSVQWNCTLVLKTLIP